jgi:thiamine pyrophosphate-dependent acetolactate synthase large subunit-like protein
MANINPLRLLVTATAADTVALQETLAAAELSVRLERAETLDELRAWLPKLDWQVLVAHAGASLSPAQVLQAARELAPERQVLVVADPATPTRPAACCRPARTT